MDDWARKGTVNAKRVTFISVLAKIYQATKEIYLENGKVLDKEIFLSLKQNKEDSIEQVFSFSIDMVTTKVIPNTRKEMNIIIEVRSRKNEEEEDLIESNVLLSIMQGNSIRFTPFRVNEELSH